MNRSPVAVSATLIALLAGVATVSLAGPGVADCVAQAGGGNDVEARLCPGGPVAVPISTRPGPGSGTGKACVVNTRLRGVKATPRGRGVRFAFTRRGAGPVTVDVFRVSNGRRVLGERRVARFTGRKSAFTWSGRGAGAAPGDFVVRYTARSTDTRRIALRRVGGRFAPRPAFVLRDGCGALRTFKLERPVFGGSTRRTLGISYRVSRSARVTVTVTRAGRTVRRFAARSARSGRTYRLRLSGASTRRGDHRVTVTVRPTSGAASTARLTAARL